MDLPPTEVIEQVPAVEEQRSYTRENGTLVIDILVEPRCGESTEREIVVCAPGEDVQPYDPSPPQQEEGFKPELQLSENAKVGLRAQPGRDGAVEALVNLTIAF